MSRMIPPPRPRTMARVTTPTMSRRAVRTAVSPPLTAAHVLRRPARDRRRSTQDVHPDGDLAVRRPGRERTKGPGRPSGRVHHRVRVPARPAVAAIRACLAALARHQAAVRLLPRLLRRRWRAVARLPPSRRLRPLCVLGSGIAHRRCRRPGHADATPPGAAEQRAPGRPVPALRLDRARRVDGPLISAAALRSWSLPLAVVLTAA